MTNKEKIEAITIQQDWNYENQAALALSFIYERELTTEYIEFLELQAAEENSEGT